MQLQSPWNCLLLWAPPKNGGASGRWGAHMPFYSALGCNATQQCSAGILAPTLHRKSVYSKGLLEPTLWEADMS